MRYTPPPPPPKAAKGKGGPPPAAPPPAPPKMNRASALASFGLGRRGGRSRLAAGIGVLCFAAIVGFTAWGAGLTGAAAKLMRDGMSHGAARAGFVVSGIEVRGARRTAEHEIKRRLAVEPGEPIFNLSLMEARARVLALPWIAEARVARLLPNRISVVVTERAPAAIWRRDGKAVVIDTTGVVIADADPAAHADLPEVTGAGAPAAVGDLVIALAEAPAVRDHAVLFVRQGERRWDVRTHAHATVKLPEGPARLGLGRIEALHAARGVLTWPAETIDLRGQAIYIQPRARERLRERGA